MQIELLNDNDKDIEEFSEWGLGHSEAEISKEQYSELLKDKVLGLFDGEYTHILRVKKE